MVIDYYAVLELNPGASVEEIKAAFKRMAKKWHPDMHANESEKMRKYAEEMFKKVLQAYEGLLNGQTSGEWSESSDHGKSRRQQHNTSGPENGSRNWEQSGNQSETYWKYDESYWQTYDEPYYRLRTVQYVMYLIRSIRNPYLKAAAYAGLLVIGALLGFALWKVAVLLFHILLAVLTFLWHCLIVAAVLYTAYKVAILII